MQRTKSIKMLLVAIGMLSLVACSTTKPGGVAGADGAGAATENAEGVQVAGAGDDTSFSAEGGPGNAANPLEVGNQTYYFDFNRSDVHDGDMPSIKVQAKYLATHPSAKVLLEGNTDPRGSREYNIALGERRAQSVANALKLEGVSAKQIRVVSYGAEKLATAGHTEEDYAKDRRVNLVYEAK